MPLEKRHRPRKSGSTNKPKKDGGDVPRRKKGRVAWLLDGLEPKQAVMVLLALGTSMGGCWKSEVEVAGARVQTEQVEARYTYQRGRLRATVDSLKLQVSALKLQVNALGAQVAHGKPAVVMSVGPDEQEWVGPPEPVWKGTLLKSIFGWLRRG